MKVHLPYDPGQLPTNSEPKTGTVIEFSVNGYPPVKDTSFSIRNPKHKEYDRFTILRRVATEAMKGRAWTHSLVQILFELYAPNLESGRNIVDYLSGIMDTLDGSHGDCFTYLPIIYNDDSQVVESIGKLVQSKEVWYKLKVCIL